MTAHVDVQARLHARYQRAQQLVQHAGAHALALFRRRDTLVIEDKGLQDMVSIADREVEVILRDGLAAGFPDDGFVGEEGGTDRADAAWLWVIDPIDGTACFVNGMFAWCLSVALLHDGEPVAGVVFDPNSGELFHAVQGGGAWCVAASGNRQPLCVRDAAAFKDGVLGVGFSHRVGTADFIPFLDRVLQGGGMFVRNGSGALMIAYVAAGRLIGYYEPHINAWDCLAGIVLAREAGAVCNQFLAGDGLRLGNPIVVAGPRLYGPLLAAIAPADAAAAQWQPDGMSVANVQTAWVPA